MYQSNFFSGSAWTTYGIEKNVLEPGARLVENQQGSERERIDGAGLQYDEHDGFVAQVGEVHALSVLIPQPRGDETWES